MNKTSFFITLSLIFLCFNLLHALDDRHYPGRPFDAPNAKDRIMLDASKWPADKNFPITSDCDGLQVASTVSLRWSHELVATSSHPIKQGKLLKVTTRFYLTHVKPGSQFEMRLQLLDQNNNVLSSEEIASCSASSPDHLVYCEKYIQLSPEIASARPTVKFSGNPAAAKIVQLSMQTVASKEPLPTFPLKVPYSNKCLNDEELTEYLQKRPKIHASVKRNGDMVEFLVNGQATPLKIYKNSMLSSLPNYPDFLKKTPVMQQIGFNLFTVGVYLGLPCHARTPNSVWMADGSYQVEVISKTMRQILKYAPDAMIMLEFFITPREGWSETNQDEVVQWTDGRKAVFCGGGRIRKLTNEPPEVLKPVPTEPWSMPIWIPSYFSDKFTNDASKAIFDIFTELEKHPESNALAAVFMSRGVDMQWFDLFAEIPATATEKAIYPLADYSPASRQYFINFLRRKYDNDLDKMRQAWQEPDVKSFEEIQVPAHDELFPRGQIYLRQHGKHDRIADFIESRGDGLANQFISFARAIKQATGNRVIVGGYRAEGAITSWPFLVQQCSRKMYNAPEVDFFASCPGGRTPENPVMPSLLNGSLRMHNKLGVTEMDFRTPWCWNWGVWGEPFYYKTHDEKEFRQRTLRAQICATAFGGAFHAFDMDGYWYDTPMALNTWKRNNAIYNQRKPKSLSNNRIALIYSEHYWEYMALNSTRAFAHIVKNTPREAGIRSGIDCDAYLLDDVFHPDFPAPKVLCFLDSLELSQDKADEIRRKYGKDGRVLVWMWAPGAGATDDISSIAGFNLRKVPEADGCPVMALEECNDPLMNGVSGILLEKYRPWGMGPAWAIEDETATILGKYYGTKLNAMGVKRYEDHTEIFIGQGGNLTASLLRNIAKEAGAHCWIDSNDAAASAGNLLMISATSTGEKVIHLPSDTLEAISMTGQEIRQEGNQVVCTLEYGDVLILDLIERP